jgi:hypothetical protein
MSAERSVPSTGPSRATLTLVLAVVAALAVAVGYVAGYRAGATHDTLAVKASEAQRVAFVREARCGDRACQTLWIGRAREDAMEVAALQPGTERCEEIAMAKDGLRLGFLINGYQLRVFDGETRKPINQVNLLEPDRTPSSRIARGVTFSTNGASVTFDDCPRDHSGCRYGLAAVR